MRRLEAQTKRGISNGEMMVSTTGVMLSSRNDFGLPERILHYSCIVFLMTYEKSSKRTHLQNVSLVLRSYALSVGLFQHEEANEQVHDHS